MDLLHERLAEEANRLNGATSDLVRSLIHAGEDVSRLRERALKLRDEMVNFMARFSEARGPKVVCPVTRAWYLLVVMDDHATLLKD